MALSLIGHTGSSPSQQTEGDALNQKMLAQGTASWAASPAVRAAMQGNRSKNTRPEIALRRELHGLGLRYRINTTPIPGVRRTADVVFTRRKVAVFVDGCFWHGCPEHYRPPTTNDGYWRGKLERNTSRDDRVNALLAEAGWEVVRIWEHESPTDAAARIARLVRTRS